MRNSILGALDLVGEMSATEAFTNFEALPHGHEDKLAFLWVATTIYFMAMDGELAEVPGHPGVFKRA